jgi:cytochrome c-type protein NapB
MTGNSNDRPPGGDHIGPPHPRVAGIGSAILVMLGLVLLFGNIFMGAENEPSHPPALSFDGFERPITAEADVFLLGPDELGVAPSAEGVEAAHPRTLEMFRKLRAFPGAPPRIPHGLTDEEFRVGRCTICHLRGGYVARFGTYAPVTPHPEYSSCLQCHVGSDTVVGTPLPTRGEDSCRQCHVDPEAVAPTFVGHDWIAAAWPERGQRAMTESPLWIPHDRQLRGNCLACHSGPGAMNEIRTDHPERTNCLQCHVPAPVDDAVFPPRPEGAP